MDHPCLGTTAQDTPPTSNKTPQKNKGIHAEREKEIGQDTEEIVWHLRLPPMGNSTGKGGGNKIKRQKGSNAKVQEYQASYATLVK